MAPWLQRSRAVASRPVRHYPPGIEAREDVGGRPALGGVPDALQVTGEVSDLVRLPVTRLGLEPVRQAHQTVPLTAACRQAREVICSWRALGVGRGFSQPGTGQRPLRSGRDAKPIQRSPDATSLEEVPAHSPVTGTASLASSTCTGPATRSRARGPPPRSASHPRREAPARAGRTGGRTVPRP